MRFEDITEDFYQSIVKYSSKETDYVGYCIPAIVKKDFYSKYYVYGCWMPTASTAIQAYEKCNLKTEQIVQFNLLDNCEIYYDICPRCKNKSNGVNDVKERYNSYKYDVNNKSENGYYKIMCKECENSIRDDTRNKTY